MKKSIFLLIAFFIILLVSCVTSSTQASNLNIEKIIPDHINGDRTPAPVSDFRIEERTTDVIIWAYTGDSSIVVLPDEINGKPLSVRGTAFGRDVIEVFVNSTNKNLISVNGVLYSKDGTMLISYPRGRDESTFIIPNHVTKIDSLAFSGANNLIEVVFSKNLEHIYLWAFFNCVNLGDIDLPETITYIGSEAFSGCLNIHNINIPDSLERAEIAINAFRGIENLNERTKQKILLFWGSSVL